MDLKTYLAQKRGLQTSLANAIGAYAPDVSRWANGTRSIPFHYGAPIEAATAGKVSRKDLFPDEWEKHWPELLTEKSDP